VAAANNWARRRSGTNPSTRAFTMPIAFSIPARCVAVKRFATCAVVVDAGVGTGSNCCPAVSARRWSIPTRKSAPVRCADAIDSSNPPADTPRRRVLIDPTASSNAEEIPNTRSNSATAATPA